MPSEQDASTRHSVELVWHDVWASFSDKHNKKLNHENPMKIIH